MQVVTLNQGVKTVQQYVHGKIYKKNRSKVNVTCKNASSLTGLRDKSWYGVHKQDEVGGEIVCIKSIRGK